MASPLGFAVAGAAVLLAGFLRGFVGFGAALITVPVLSVIFTPAIAVAITFISGLPTVIQLLPTAVRHAERALALPLTVGAVLLAPAGAYLLVSIDPRALKIGIAVAVIVMVGFLQTGWRPRRPPGWRALFGVGAAAGLIQGIAGIGGPPVVAVVLARPSPPIVQRANLIAAVTALSLSTALPFWRLGLFTETALWLSLFFVPAHMAAAMLGARYFAKGGQRHFRKAALAILAVIGVATFIAALQDYIAHG